MCFISINFVIDRSIVQFCCCKLMDKVRTVPLYLNFKYNKGEGESTSKRGTVLPGNGINNKILQYFGFVASLVFELLCAVLLDRSDILRLCLTQSKNFKVYSTRLE